MTLFLFRKNAGEKCDFLIPQSIKYYQILKQMLANRKKSGFFCMYKQLLLLQIFVVIRGE